MDDVNKWIRDENEKRMAEAEALRAKLEREKQELRDFLEQGSNNSVYTTYNVVIFIDFITSVVSICHFQKCTCHFR